MEKIKVAGVFLERAEGRIEECVSVRVGSMAEAESTLNAWARTAPGPHKGYHKCDFQVEWVDGHAWSGRYDLNKERDADESTLAGHIRFFLLFHSGSLTPEQLPAHLTPEEYKAMFRGRDTAGAKEGYRKMFERYEIQGGVCIQTRQTVNKQ